MELIFAFLFALFSFHGDATYHQAQPHDGPKVTTDFASNSVDSNISSGDLQVTVPNVMQQREIMGPSD